MPLTAPAFSSAPVVHILPVTAQQQALRLLLQDTVACVGNVDLTDRIAMHGCLNLVDRLLAVLPERAPRLQELTQALQSAAATTRATLAASLYRELAELAARHGAHEPALADE